MIKEFKLKNNQIFTIREATAADALSTLEYVNGISGESDFLTFGPGEFEITEPQEEEFLQNSFDSNNKIYLLGLIQNQIIATLHFGGGHRPRIQHTGEFGLSVQKGHWGLGVGALMLDFLINWARESQVVKKINLKVRIDNHRAIQLYKRKGFEIEGTVRKDIFINGKYFDNYLMGLII